MSPAHTAEVTTAMPRGCVFLSYRRADSADIVGRLFDRLAPHFPAGFVFRDLDGIAPGAVFPDVLRRKLFDAVAVLVVIGPRWLNILHERRSHEIDHVREEVRQALALGSNRVVPVLVGGAAMPTAADLADFPDLAGLALRNALPLRPDPDFAADLARVVAAVEGLRRSAPLPADPDGDRRIAPARDLCAELTRLGGPEPAGARIRLGDPVFRVAVVGRRKAGKSSLVNALLGVPAVPVDVAVSPRVPVFVRGGLDPSAELHFGPPPYPRPAADWPDALRTHLASSRQVSPLRSTPAEVGAWLLAVAESPDVPVARGEIVVPCDILHDGVELIDAPGYDAADSPADALDAADAAVLVGGGGRRDGHFARTELDPRDLSPIREVTFPPNDGDLALLRRLLAALSSSPSAFKARAALVRLKREASSLRLAAGLLPKIEDELRRLPDAPVPEDRG